VTPLLPALDDRLLTDFWHLVAHRAELAEPGAWLRLDWPGGDLALFNDEGEILAFDNVCPHRGARYFTGDHGVGRMVCPYHGWAYRAGQLRVAQRAAFDEAELAGIGLRTFRTAWCGDFLFVGLAPVESLDTQLGEAFADLERASRRITARRDFNAFSFQANWRVGVENALEGYHVNPIHPQTLAPLGLVDERIDYQGRNIGYLARIGQARTAKGLSVMKRFFEVDEAYEGYWSLYVFPFAMVSSTFGYSYALQTYFPSAAPNQAHFCSRLLTSRVKPGAEAAVEGFFESSAQVNRRIFEEDHAICARVSSSYDMTRPGRVFARSEERVRRLHAILTDLNG
jgi:phenylpropionate dioxygenase-like ring-hydroxylating dioxygenase large terminal subunit